MQFQKVQEDEEYADFAAYFDDVNGVGGRIYITFEKGTKERTAHMRVEGDNNLGDEVFHGDTFPVPLDWATAITGYAPPTWTDKQEDTWQLDGLEALITEWVSSKEGADEMFGAVDYLRRRLAA